MERERIHHESEQDKMFSGRRIRDTLPPSLSQSRNLVPISLKNPVDMNECYRAFMLERIIDCTLVDRRLGFKKYQTNGRTYALHEGRHVPGL